MSINSNAYYSNAIVGTPQVGADIDITAVDATPKYAVGFGFTRADGNRYRYGYSSGGVAAGVLVAPTFATAGMTTGQNLIIATASSVAVSGDTIKPGAAGSRFFEMTLATTAAGKYKGGYLVIEDGTGVGYTYRIKGNTATDNPATGNIRVELYETLKTNLSTDTDITITPCLWNDVAVCGSFNGGTNVIAAGVSQGTTTTTSPYGWFCTHGNTSCLQDGTLIKGNGIMPSMVTTGAVSAFFGAFTTVAQVLGLFCVGYCTAIGATTKQANCYIIIE